MARARQIADLQTAAIAEQYRDNPLLEGLSVPRVRIPELRIDLPILIEGQTGGVPGALRDPELVAREVVSAVADALAVAEEKLPPGLRQRLQNRLTTELTRAASPRTGEPLTRESLAHHAQTATRELLTGTAVGKRLGAGGLRTVLDAVRHRVGDVDAAEAGSPPGISVNVLSGQIKEQASPSMVSRLSITVREEGLEWETFRTGEGAVRSRLGPE
ncbi:hypothetical protein [Streptomyces boetiae]|uniref:hypothetical protein n=1 Tax=Streptomyces boetiae TaxID=3075541 RepID=UPI00288AEAC3|nr:hypothetical protein [Streptomyces sp. DSM 44917]